MNFSDTSFLDLTDLLDELDDILTIAVPVLIIAPLGNISVGYRSSDYSIAYEIPIGNKSDMADVIQKMNNLIIETRSQK